MRKFFYSISVFLFLCLLSLGYYQSYQRVAVKDHKEKENQGEKQSERTSAGKEKGDYGQYYLKGENGRVVVYESDKETVYESTSIGLSSLPEKLKEEISGGKYIKTPQELYSFLENYTS